MFPHWGFQKSFKTNFMIELIGGLGLFVIIIVYNSFSWGFVTYKFYNWFVLPAIAGLPHFSILEFVGFMLFLGAFIGRKSTTMVKDEYREKGTEWLILVIGPWISLGCGALLRVMFF